MDWLLGRKKSEPKVEEAKVVTTQIVDGFIAYPPMPEQPSYPTYPSLPHFNDPSIAAFGAASLPPQPTYSPSQRLNPPNKQHQTNPLDSIPFKLSSRFEISSDQKIPQDLLRIKHFLSDLKTSLNSSELNYDFRLEISVLRETNDFSNNYSN